MKVAVISFHKNIGRYPEEWISRYRRTVIDQTYKDYQIFELNYGGEENRIFDNSIFFSIPMEDHAKAHNYLLDHCFNEGYDAIMNTNVDDYYPLNTLEILVANYDKYFCLISGNYKSFSQYEMSINTTRFHLFDIEKEFNRGHNIIAHPCCLYTRTFLNYNESLRSDEIPRDDFNLWKRMYKKGAKFRILPDVLLNYRISNLKTNSTTDK